MEEESKKEVAKAYGKSDLKGLRVEHSTEKFKTGQAIILTLKDTGTIKADRTGFKGCGMCVWEGGGGRGRKAIMNIVRPNTGFI